MVKTKIALKHILILLLLLTAVIPFNDVNAQFTPIITAGSISITVTGSAHLSVHIDSSSGYQGDGCVSRTNAGTLTVTGLQPGTTYKYWTSPSFNLDCGDGSRNLGWFLGTTFTTLAGTDVELPNIDDITIIAGASHTTQLPIATEGAVETYILACTPTLGQGLSYTSSTRTLAGTPTGARVYECTYTGESVAGAEDDSTTFTLTVVSAITFSPSSIADINLIAKIAYTSIALPVPSGGIGQLTITVPGLPTGLSYDSATRIISGTPLNAQVNTQYTYTVTDSEGNTKVIAFNIEINEPSLVISKTSLIDEELPETLNVTINNAIGIGSYRVYFEDSDAAVNCESAGFYRADEAITYTDPITVQITIGSACELGTYTLNYVLKIGIITVKTGDITINIVEPSSGVLTVTQLGATTATIIYSGYSDPYYFRQIAPSIGTCTNRGTNYTIQLTGLTANTVYSYGTYSNSTCNLILSTISFTAGMPTLASSNIKDRSFTLTINSWSSTWYLNDSGSLLECTQVRLAESTYTVTLASPTTAYTLTAYSDSACQTSITAPITVTTIASSGTHPLPTTISGSPTSIILNSNGSIIIIGKYTIEAPLTWTNVDAYRAVLSTTANYAIQTVRLTPFVFCTYVNNACEYTFRSNPNGFGVGLYVIELTDTATQSLGWWDSANTDTNGGYSSNINFNLNLILPNPPFNGITQTTNVPLSLDNVLIQTDDNYLAQQLRAHLLDLDENWDIEEKLIGSNQFLSSTYGVPYMERVFPNYEDYELDLIDIQISPFEGTVLTEGEIAQTTSAFGAIVMLDRGINRASNQLGAPRLIIEAIIWLAPTLSIMAILYSFMGSRAIYIGIPLIVFLGFLGAAAGIIDPRLAVSVPMLLIGIPAIIYIINRNIN